MRDRDRWWWVLLILGFAFCAVGIVVTYLLVSTTPSPANNPYVTSADYWQYIGMDGVVLLVGLTGGFVFAGMSLHQRKQHIKRLAAFRGDTGALALAAIQPDPGHAPDVMDQPLVLRWRLSTTARLTQVPLIGIQALIGLFIVGLSLVEVLAPIFLTPQSTPTDLFYHVSPQPMSVTEIAWRVAVACAILALVAGTGIFAVRALPYLRGRPFGLTATSAGIDGLTELGAKIHMAWDDMRLLEVEPGDLKANRRFSLYAPGLRIHWTEYRATLGAEHVAADISATEMTQRQAELLSLIAARTGLAPRTLAKALVSRAAPTPANQRASNAITLLVFALVFAGIAIADLLLPPTLMPWLNWLSVGSLALASLGLVFASLGSGLARTTLPAHAAPPSVGAPSLDAATVEYSLRWRTPRLRRLLLGALGVLLVANLVPAAWTLLQQYALYLPGPHPELLAQGVFTTLGHIMLGVFLAFCGLMGMVLVYVSAALSTVHIRADQNGLTSGGLGRSNRLLLWSTVSDISWGSGPRSQFSYLVKTDDPTVQANWPAGLHLTDILPPDDGALPIGADELAALVAARTGKPIRVRNGG